MINISKKNTVVVWFSQGIMKTIIAIIYTAVKYEDDYILRCSNYDKAIARFSHLVRESKITDM